MRYHSRKSNRYENYREMIAKYAGQCACGARVDKGDRMAYCAGRVMCASCWDRWTVEVRQEEQAERMAMDSMGYDLSYSGREW